MYWLGFLAEPKEAGELDWQAIGGTWGVATSRLAKWSPSHDCLMPTLAPIVRIHTPNRAAQIANYCRFT